MDLTLRAATPLARRKHADGVAARTAALSIADHRTAALVTQVLLGAGLRLRGGKKPSPGNADVWVTRPSPAALKTAQRWHARGKKRSLVLLGEPAASTRARWLRLGAAVIDPPDDFEAMRHTISLAARGGDEAEPPKETT